MKKYARIIVVSIVCIGLIVGYYYYLSSHDKKNVENGTEVSEVDEVLLRDLEKDYPPTPREVVKFYNQILSCFYNEEYKDDELREMAEQARALMDEELAANNPKEQYLSLLKSDIAGYKEKGRVLSDTTVEGSGDIEYQTVDGKKCAYVTSSYFIKEGNSYSRSYQEYVLRKDENKQWKILGYQLVEGEASDE